MRFIICNLLYGTVSNLGCEPVESNNWMAGNNGLEGMWRKRSWPGETEEDYEDVSQDGWCPIRD